jgi:energy-converting hydrogenase Eha subunit A
MARGAGTARAKLALAALVLHLVLIQPNHPAAMTWGALVMFPLELPVILLGLVALPPGARATTLLRAALVALLMLIAVAKLADYATFTAFNRGFNLLVDVHLIHAAWMLGSGSIGVVPAALTVALAAAGLGLGGWLVWWSTGQWAALAPGVWLRGGAAAMLVPAGALMVGEIGHALRAWQMPVSAPGAAFTARVGYERVVFYRAALADLEEFRREAAQDPFAGADPDRLFDRIGAHDVLLVFVESYGRSSFLNPLYIDTHTGTLAEYEARLDARGLAMRSAFLTAPMVGGQSWLAHGAVASGLWTDNQRRYQALLASGRRTLFHYAQAAGFHTAAIMPAIVMGWPEADFFGFDAIHVAADLGYEGERFNWVTMPDQFTMKAFDRLERQGRAGVDRPPLFAQIALISSHAPWVPVPELIDWDAIGDGTVFNEVATSGDPPEVVWRDHDRVRDQFRQAVDYSLQVVGAYAERHADDPPLMIVLGDHEPAPFVSGVDGFDVPIHIIGPPDVVARIDGWGWDAGLLPGPDAPVWRMDAFRDRFLDAFSSAEPGSDSSAGLQR